MAVRSVLRAALLMMFIGIAFQGCNLFKQKSHIEQAVELHETVISEAVRIFQTDFKKYNMKPLTKVKSTGSDIEYYGKQFFETVSATFARVRYAAYEDINSAGVANIQKTVHTLNMKILGEILNEECVALDMLEVEFVQIVKENTNIPSDFAASCVARTTKCSKYFMREMLAVSEDIQNLSKETH
eukprot:GEMP01046691.1.p1 GENE.GEMP01046691.1~~GEMP01046691.1.p1  ORF type:complete len:185 (+),score=10.25 GEMP01046691.1:135-689(+)